MSRASQIGLLAAVVAAAAISAIVTLTLAGGTSGTGQRIDPSFADARAHLALPLESDLPAGAWYTASADDFRDSNNSSRSIATCKAWNDALDGLEARFNPNLAGRASRRFGLAPPRPGAVGMLVSYQIFVYHDDRGLREYVQTLQDIGRDDYESCVGELLKGLISTTSVARLTNVTPLTDAPAGGFAAGAGALNQATKQTLYEEFYLWQAGNAIVQVEVLADKDALSRQVVDQLLGLATSGIDRAAASKPGPPPQIKLATPEVRTAGAAGTGFFTGSVLVGLTDNVPAGTPYVIQNVYNPNVRQISAVVSIDHARAGMRVEGRWYQMHVFDAGAATPGNFPPTGTLVTAAGFEITADAINQTTGRGGGRLTLNPTIALPEDSYVLQVFVDGLLAKEVPFVVSRVVAVR